jgi:hypothetical protein
MKKTIGLISIVLVVLCAFGWSGYAQRKPAKPTWEYKAVGGQDLSDQTLNELGTQGWELVSVTAYGDLRTGHSETAYLKRAK